MSHERTGWVWLWQDPMPSAHAWDEQTAQRSACGMWNIDADDVEAHQPAEDAPRECKRCLRIAGDGRRPGHAS